MVIVKVIVGEVDIGFYGYFVPETRCDKVEFSSNFVLWAGLFGHLSLCKFWFHTPGGNHSWWLHMGLCVLSCILQDNFAPLHKFWPVLKTNTINQPLYSPDFSPWDFFLFTNHGTCFQPFKGTEQRRGWRHRAKVYALYHRVLENSVHYWNFIKLAMLVILELIIVQSLPYCTYTNTNGINELNKMIMTNRIVIKEVVDIWSYFFEICQIKTAEEWTNSKKWNAINFD